MTTVESLRLAGNEKFKEADYAAAADLYEQGLEAAAGAEQQEQQPGALDADRLKLLNNLSTCRRKLKQYGPALDAASRAVALDPTAPKSRLLRSVLVAEKHSNISSSTDGDGKESEEVDVRSVLSDAAVAALLEPTTFPQVLDAFEFVAKKMLLSAAPAKAEPPQQTSIKIAPTTSKGDDLGVFATDDIPCCSAIVDCSAALPFSVGLYAETVSSPFVPSEGGVGGATAPVQNNTTVCTCCGRCREEEGSTPAPPLTLFPCNGCGLAAFCEGCATGAATKTWYSERHRNHECQRMKKLMAMFTLAEQQQREGSDELLELGSHIISTISSIEFWNEKKQNHQSADENMMNIPDVEFLLSLKGDSDSGSNSQLQHTYGRELQLIHSIFDDEEGDADAKKALVNKVAGICLCNSFGCADSTGLPSCQVLFATTLSRLNHSCAPNCEFDSAARTVKTIDAVPSGTQLCISYIANMHYPTPQRREQIKNRYFFNCECARCTGGSNMEWMLTATNRVGGGAEMEAALLRTHAPVVHNIVEFARARPAEEVTRELLSDLQQRQGALERDLKRTHFLVQDLRNAVTFCASALDDAGTACSSSRDEWLLWEALFPGVALPAKRDKLRNMILSASSSSSSSGLSDDLKKFVSHVATPMLAFYEQE